MKAKDFFEKHAKTGPSHPVDMTLVSDDGKVAGKAPAVFRLLTDKLMAEAGGDAEQELAHLKTPLNTEITAAYHHSSVLFMALRDKDSPLEPFFESAAACRERLLPSERIRLMGEYQMWREKEYPDVVDVDTFRQMVEDAKGFSFGVLLSKFGYWPIRRALPSLVSAFGPPPTT